MTIIKERRFKLSLYTSNEDFTKENDFICELQSCQLTFQLSSIPKAVIRPIFGTVINKEKATVTSFDNLFSLAKERTPVKIILHVTQNFSSEVDGTDDASEWDVKLSSTPDEFGQYTTDPITIFEGYLTPPTTEIFSTKVNLTLVVQHWLSSLANISMLTTACHTSTPAELALQCYNIQAMSAPSDKAQWLKLSHDTINLNANPDGLWKDGIKPLFEAVLNAPGFATYNKFTNDQKKRIQIALGKIDGTPLHLRTNVSSDNKDANEADIKLLGVLISTYLNAEGAQPYFKQSAWDRLMYFSTCFLFSLVPRVSDAKLIPLPCLIDPDEVTYLNEDDIFQINSSPLASVPLSRLICVSATATNKTGGGIGAASHVVNASYPTKEEGYFQEGYIKAISYPEWLIRGFPQMLPEKELNPMVYSFDEELQSAVEKAEKKKELFAKAHKNIMNTIGRGFVKASYIIQALNTTWATIVTPARMDICPGSMIDCFIPDNYKNDSNIALDLYGIVTGVVVSIISGTTASTTQITMSQIRPGTAVYDPIINPYRENPCTTGFYSAPWLAKGVKLYD